MIPLVSSLSDFSCLMKPLDHYLVSECDDLAGYELLLIGLLDSPSSDGRHKHQVLAKVGTCRGDVRVFKTLDSIRAWLIRNQSSPYVEIRVQLNVFHADSSPLSPFSAFRCKGCGKGYQAAYVGAPVCHRCDSSLSLECDARTE